MTPTPTDQIHRFIFDNSDIRGEIVTLEQSLSDAFAHQNYPLAIRALLGEFLAAAALLSRTLKFDGTLALQARGDGDLTLIMAEINHQRKVRCVAQTHSTNNLDHRSLRSLLGEGVLSIIIDPDNGKRYQGIVALEGDSLAQSLEAYFMQSEQLPTKIWLSRNETKASGLLLQHLPQQCISKEENADLWETQVHLASTVSDDELLTLDHATLLTRLFHERGVRIFDAESISFSCSCSQERSNNTLRQLGLPTLQQIIDEEGKIDVDCHFCGFKYTYFSDDVHTLFSQVTHH